MSQFHLIADDFDVGEALAQLDAQPELWNQYGERRGATSPHRETDDIWLRFRPYVQLRQASDYLGSFDAAWYPGWQKLPAVRRLYDEVTTLVRPTDFGGVAITRIPAGKMVYPHHDRGGWHSEYHTTKVWLILRANDACINYCDDESVVMRPGEAWTYSNLVTHAVENAGDTERICLICCFRCEP
jgi:mannose-6-phosphate isomerase-like protein (cupin superfamily)